MTPDKLLTKIRVWLYTRVEELRQYHPDLYIHLRTELEKLAKEVEGVHAFLAEKEMRLRELSQRINNRK